tara:strand:+ start:2953 stop:4836 length:1884 start_codon:yes stop_codon:yes gene_type:complete
MNFNKILNELCWRLDTGIPDLTNPDHQEKLKNVLQMHGYSALVITEVLSNLNEADKVDPDTMVKYKDDNGESKEMVFSSANNQPAGTPAKIAADKLQPEDEEDKSGNKPEDKKEPKSDDDSEDDALESEEDPADLAKAQKAMYNIPEPGSDNEAELEASLKSKSEKLKKSKNLESDHKTVDAQLGMTKKGAKKQAAKTGKKDVGAGTAESRAGEAMVHKGIRMFQEGSSLVEIESLFMGIANNPDSVLNSKSGKDWVKSAIASVTMINGQFGIENIKAVSWDTSGGREELGIDVKLETSSDMFVQLKNGKNIGISLKKSGVVFLANGGWAKQSKILADTLRDSMSDEDMANFRNATSIETYDLDLKNKAMLAITGLDLDDYTKKVSNLKSHPDFQKDFGGSQGPRYLQSLSNLTALKTRFKDGTASKIDLKAFAKLLKVYKDPIYDELRSADHGLTQRTFEALNHSEAASTAMKTHIVKSMHIMDTLGLNSKLKDGGVDGFTTVYGIPPDGAVLNEKSLVSLLGDQFKETLDKVRSGELGRNSLEAQIASQISMNYSTGEIIFTHETGRAQPIFTLKGRSKSIGASPTMEMAQTTYMVYALKNGTFDVDDWDAKSKKAYDKLMAREN